MSTKITNNHREILYVQDTAGTNPVPLTSTNGLLNVSGGGGGGGSASVVGIGPLGLNNTAYDSVVYTNTSSTVDTYQFYAGGTGGTLKATVTLTYTDTTKSQISSAVRT